MGNETGSVRYYENQRILFTHLDEFEDKANTQMLNNGKKHAIICIDIQNKHFISDIFGASFSVKADEYVVQVICGKIIDRGIALMFYAGTIIVIISYTEISEVTDTVNDIRTSLGKCIISESSLEFRVDLVACIHKMTGEISIREAADKLFAAIKYSEISSGHFFYDDMLDEKISKELEIIKSVDEAIANDEFHIFLQPQHYLQHEDRVLSAEALVRWIKKDGTMVYPNDFIPVLERNGLITKLDCHVMELACRFISRHLNDRWFDDIVISVNVSKVDLRLSDFIEYYTGIRNKYNIPDGRIEIEFTESAVFEDYYVFKQIMLRLRKSGFFCSIDDFGTGSSSLNMLKSMPVDVLKMDRMFFVCDNENDVERNNSVIASVVAMARGLGMKIVAEGIESPESIDFLRKIGCDVIQGYVYSKPLSLEQFEAYVKNYIPKYLPVAETFKPVINDKDIFADRETLYHRYIQMLPYISAFVMELDIEADTYNIISYGQGKTFMFEPNGQYSGFYENIILKNIHPDFADIVSTELSLKSILAAFYRGDSEAEFELKMRVYDTEQTDPDDESLYEWCLCRVYFQKISKTSKPIATIYISNIQEQKEQELSVISAQRRLNNAIKGLICEIYDYDIKNRKADLLHTGIKKNKLDEIGSGPCIADFNSYIENYIHEDDRAKVTCILSDMEKTNYTGNEDYYTEYRTLSPLGDMRWKSIHFMMDNDYQGKNATMIVNDIDERKIAELKKERHSRKDKNTGVYSLYDFYESVQEFIEREGKTGDHVMIMLSITDFEKIKAKDYQYSLDLEAAFVKCMRRAIRKDDIMGKYSDGRFVIFLKGIGIQYIPNFTSKTRSVFENEKYMDTDLSDFCMGISVLKDKNKTVHRMSMETLGALELAEQRGRSEIIITE